MKFQSVMKAYFFFRAIGFGRLRAYRFARSVMRQHATVEVLTIEEN